MAISPEDTYAVPGDGTGTDWSFTFKYLDETDIKVSIDGVNTTAYSLLNATQIRLDSAPPNPSTIRIYRVTNTDSAQATFFAGSSVRAQDLNNNNDQLLYAIQETVDRRLDRSGGTMTGELDMGTNKIVNLGTPTASADAATKAYVDTADALKVAKAGDTMSGALAMGSNKITDLADPTVSGDAATKGYVDGVAIAGISPGTANQILQTNDAATGVEWVDDVDIPGNLSVNGTGFVQVASGTSAQRDALTAANGMFRYNTDDDAFEGYADGAWGAIGGGASAGGAIYENSNSISEDYTLTTNTNGLSAGPVTIDSGVTVTIPTGSNWVIV